VYDCAGVMHGALSASLIPRHWREGGNKKIASTMAASRQVYVQAGVRCIPMYFPLRHFSDEWN